MTVTVGVGVTVYVVSVRGSVAAADQLLLRCLMLCHGRRLSMREKPVLAVPAAAQMLHRHLIVAQ